MYEEGWSYVAEWIGTPLIEVLKASGVLPQARYLVYFSIDPDWWESIDIADAQHPQTLRAWAMNDADLPVAFGGPLRLRVPRQLGYKSLKFVNRLTRNEQEEKASGKRADPDDSIAVTADERRIADELGKILYATARNEQGIGHIECSLRLCPGTERPRAESCCYWIVQVMITTDWGLYLRR